MSSLSSRQKTTSLFIVAMCGLMMVTLTRGLNSRNLQKTIDQTLRTHNLLQTLDRLEITLADAEIGQRGFLLTGEAAYLSFMKTAESRAWGYYNTADYLTQNEPDKSSVVQALKPLIEKKIARLDQTTALKAQGHASQALLILRSTETNSWMTQIRNWIGDIEQQEQARLIENEQIMARTMARRSRIIHGATFTSLLLLSWMFYLFRREVEERRRSQEALQENERLLERRAADLNETNKELKDFCNVVSHDLRDPIKDVEISSRQILEKYSGTFDDQGKRALGRIQNGVQRISRLIDELLRFSRITRIQIHPETVDIAELARTIGQDLQGAVPGRKVEWVVPPTLPVTADSKLLRIALEKLLDNAWKFTSRQPEARIEVGQKTSPRETVYYVRDNGTGFDMAGKGKLFVAFQRLHPDEEFPGMGMGLATAKRIIHRLGGRIWAEGEVNRGATVYFTLS